jgi:hypothetical protein
MLRWIIFGVAVLSMASNIVIQLAGSTPDGHYAGVPFDVFGSTPDTRLELDTPAKSEAASSLPGALDACAQAKGWSLDEVRPWRPSHTSAAALVYCHLTLPPALLCDPAARAGLFAAFRTYYAERDNAMRYLARVDAARSHRRQIVSTIDAEQRVAAQREAQSWAGDDEIAHKLAERVRQGFFTADDFHDRLSHADVVQSLGGIVPGPNACRDRG